MQRIALPNRWWYPNWTFNRTFAASTVLPGGTNVVLDANGEAIHLVGTIHWAGGGSHTISSSGGKIGWRSANSVSWSDGSAAHRIGLQDASGTIPPVTGDGTFDVYHEFTVAGDSISVNTFYETAMSSGTKTLAEGDYVAIVHEAITASATGRFGQYMNNTGASGAYPGTVSLGTSQVFTPLFYLIADDGAVGWIDGVFPYDGSALLFNTNDNPDEYGMTFRVPIACEVTGLWWNGQLPSTSAEMRVRLYSDPLGTPTTLVEETFDGTTHHATTSTSVRDWATSFAPVILKPNTTYCLGFKSNDTGDVRLSSLGCGSQTINEAFFGPAVSRVTRNNDSGAFGSANTAAALACAIGISALYGSPSPQGFAGIGMGG